MTIPLGAERRIRDVARGVGALGVAIALATIAGVVLPGIERELEQEARNPWREPAPLEAQREPGGTVWAAEGSARITLPDELLDRPIGVRLVDEVDDTVYAYLGDAVDGDRPFFLGSVHEYEAMPFAAYADSELWITSRHAWRVEILPVAGVELHDSANGDDDTVLVYRGRATSGTITWGPKGTLFVIARSTAGYESLATTGGDPDDERGGTVRFTWTESPFVVIEVSAYDGIAWEIELDEVPGDEVPGDEEPGGQAPGDEGEAP